MIEALGIVFATATALNLLVALASIVVSRPLGRAVASDGPAAVQAGCLPFVSVHVAIHDEPPAMVIATLAALTRLDYPAFEIVVIDNNTTDPAMWQPVSMWSDAAGPQIQFLHCMGVVGAKAGALNIALARADLRTEYVAIVDADYQVAPDFLTRAVAACANGAQFAQFPQAYRHADRAGALVAELADYFETFPRTANGAHAALLTGTLSLISVSALRSVGGWPTRSITEDAELGVRLWSSGQRGVFVAHDVGAGLLPLDLAGLRTQRQRWVSGNVQTLVGARRAIWKNGPGRLAVVAQLTAWIGLLAMPLVALIAVAVVRAADGATVSPAWRLVEGLAAATIAIALVSHVARAFIRRSPGSIAVTLALLWTSSFSWLSAFGPWPLRFKRTPKGLGGKRGGLSLDAIASWLALATAIALASEGAIVVAVVLALSASGLVAGPLVDRWLRQATATRITQCAA